jgi:hypothetical protein
MISWVSAVPAKMLAIDAPRVSAHVLQVTVVRIGSEQDVAYYA